MNAEYFIAEFSSINMKEIASFELNFSLHVFKNNTES